LGLGFGAESRRRSLQAAQAAIIERAAGTTMLPSEGKIAALPIWRTRFPPPGR